MIFLERVILKGIYLKKIEPGSLLKYRLGEGDLYDKCQFSGSTDDFFI